MDYLLDTLLLVLSRLWLALVGLVAVVFPGMLIAIPLCKNVENELLMQAICLAGLFVSIAFWRGVRTYEGGRALTEAALRLGLYNPNGH